MAEPRSATPPAELAIGSTDPLISSQHSVISTHELTKSFGTLTAVNNVTMEVHRGEIFGFLGLNGAGKTTLLKLLTGQLKPTSGSSVVMGVDPAVEPVRVKQNIGIVPEIESPPSFLTPVEFLHYVGLIRKLDSAVDKAGLKERSNRWIEFFDLLEYRDTMCKDLSKGTKQRVMLAAALFHEPPLLFLDEPFLGLDPFHQKQVKEYLAEYVRNGGTVFMCTHILEVAEKMCDRIAIIDRGRIIATGTTAELTSTVGEGGTGEGVREGLNEAFLRLTGKNVTSGGGEGEKDVRSDNDGGGGVDALSDTDGEKGNVLSDYSGGKGEL